MKRGAIAAVVTLAMAVSALIGTQIMNYLPIRNGRTLAELLPPPLVKYEVVSPCVYRYYDEPSAPGFPHPEVDGLAYPNFDVDEEHHLVTFTDCDRDAGMSGQVVFVYVYQGTPPLRLW